MEFERVKKIMELVESLKENGGACVCSIKLTEQSIAGWDPAIDLFMFNQFMNEVMNANDLDELKSIDDAYKTLNKLIVSYIREYRRNALNVYEKRVIKDRSTRFYHESSKLLSRKRREIVKKKGGAKDRINSM